jgi:hypothetical protein
MKRARDRFLIFTCLERTRRPQGKGAIERSELVPWINKITVVKDGQI